MAQNPPADAFQAMTHQPPPQGLVNVNARYSFDAQGLPTQLAWVGDLNGALDHRHCVTLGPKVPPARDATINHVKSRQEQYIREMIQAVFNMDGIHDNPTFGGRKMFIHGHKSQVSGYDVEAACRALFAAIISRCEFGYRGSAHANRLLNQGKNFEHVDRDGNCQTRIDNIIKALKEWKSICKEIVLTDSKIYNLANAPASVWQDKMEQKINNETKKKTTQKERVAAATATKGAGVTAEAIAKGPLPPVARIGRKQERKHQHDGHQDRQGSTVTLESQADFTVLPPATNITGGQFSTLIGIDDSITDSQLLFPLTANPVDSLQDPPAYASANPMSFSEYGPAPSSNQGRSYASQQGRPFVPQPDAQPFVPQQHHNVPPRLPVRNSQVPALYQHTVHAFGGYQGPVPVSYHFSGPTYSFGDRGQNSSMFNSYSSLPTPNIGSYDMYDLAADQSMSPLPDGTSLNSTIQPHQGVQNGLSHSKTAAKHNRTATMDAQFQPSATRYKRYISPEVDPGLEKVGEE